MDGTLLFGSLQNKTKQYGFSLVLFFFSVSVKSQRINSFNLFPISGGINVNFNIGPGPNCYGYKILHCLDSVSYLEIYDFPSICGTSGSNEYKSFTHSNPALNQMNYYKVQLYPYEAAYNKIFYTNDGKGTVIVFPNPVYTFNADLNLKIVGTNNTHVEGNIFNEFGNKVQQIDALTQGDVLQVNVAGYHEGVYLVWLSDGARVYSTKFIVLYSY